MTSVAGCNSEGVISVTIDTDVPSVLESAKSANIRVDPTPNRGTYMAGRKRRFLTRRFDQRIMIEARNLTKYYGRKLAVDHISFDVDANEVVGLLGPNGAGKTSTMRILTGFLPASSGTAKVAGFDVATEPKQMKRLIGYLPEQPPLYPEMRVRDFLLFVAGLKLVERSKRSAAVDRAIERCGLADRAKQRIEHLSKGYRQRVGIAHAIVHDPKLVILDEPTVGLDPQQVIGVRHLIRQLAEQMTVLVSSHILSEVEATCGHVIIINDGKVVAEDAPAALQAKLAADTGQVLWLEIGGPVEQVIERMRTIEHIRTITPVEKVSGLVPPHAKCRIECQGGDPRNDIARCVLESGAQLLSLRAEQTSLEQVFLHVTKRESKPETWREAIRARELESEKASS